MASSVTFEGLGPDASTSPGLVEIADHGDVAVSRLLMQYKGPPLREGLLRALASEAQALETAILQVYFDRALATSTGAQLDGLGDLVGEPRNGRSDADYRVYVQVRQILNRSSGASPDILNIFALLVDGAPLTLLEWFPAALTLKAAGPVTNPADLADILQQAKDGGVRAIFEYLAAPPSGSFTMGDSSAPTTSSSTGYGDSTNPAIGGAYAGAIE